MSLRSLALGICLLAGPARAQTPFQLTLTNTTGVTWSEGVFAVLPGSGSPNALLDIGQSPASGDPYDSYAYTHGSCDPYGVEDDGDAALLIARWPGLVEGVNAFRVGPLAPAGSQVVSFVANPGDVVSFIAYLPGTADDAVILHAFGNRYDATVDLFDAYGTPLTAISYGIDGYDVNSAVATGGGACAATCPPPVPCYVAPGGGANGAAAQPTTGGCTAQVLYVDQDGDGVGGGLGGSFGCAETAGTSFRTGDCNDNDPSVFPGALEVCNGFDDDCDNLVDDADDSLDMATTPQWYADVDQDGTGAAGTGQRSCVQPPGRVADATDCDDSDPDNQVSCATCVDGDGDGDFVGCDAYVVRSGPDCDDTNAVVWSGATEVCNGIDDDCDGWIDGDDPSVDPSSFATWHSDADLDGYGDPATATQACSAPPGTVTDGTDCDDSDPGNWVSCGTCLDADGDGDFAGCDAYVVRTGPDCDDGDAAVNGSALEVCNGIDDDCDALIDDQDPGLDGATTPTWHGDADADGYGASTAAIQACVQPGGTVADSTDCDDSDPDNWASCGTCVDADVDGSYVGCDAYTTRSGPDCDDANPLWNVGTTWTTDSDGDGFGDDATAVVQCTPPAAGVLVGGDCDDGDATAFPGASEVCDGDDEDCDGLVDDDDPDRDPATTPWWFSDADGDGYGDGSAGVQACIAPIGTLSDDTDCDDSDVDNWASCGTCVDQDGDSAFVGCDAYTTRDPDCDDTDPLLNAGTVWYDDVDGDGFGDPATQVVQCSPTGTGVLIGGDCDDGDPTAWPGATEVCDGDDEDCDGQVDDADPDVDLTTATTWYTDADFDGRGDPATATVACAAPPGTVPVGDDCDDGAGDVFPGAPESCDGRDEDCNGTVDDNATDAQLWYTDADGDGHGDPYAFATTCTPDPTDVLLGDDCDDSAGDAYPGALEFCDGRDQDCNGIVDDGAVDASAYYADTDGDGFGDPVVTVLRCAASAGWVGSGTDCDDQAADTYPGAPELCDGRDNDCDVDVDEGLVFTSWYDDLDGDGWGDEASFVDACDQPADSVDRPGDCDDGDDSVNPDAVEIPGDGIDQDCDGVDPSDDTGVPLPGESDRPWEAPEGDTGRQKPGPSGCACDAAGPGAAWWLLGLVALVARRRR